jgi:integration host factor subunit alpha
MLDRALEIVGEALEKTGEVKLSKFGNFIVREKSAREGRNPKTGIEATISARRVVTFRPSPKLKSRVNDN